MEIITPDFALAFSATTDSPCEAAPAAAAECGCCSDAGARCACGRCLPRHDRPRTCPASLPVTKLELLHNKAEGLARQKIGCVRGLAGVTKSSNATTARRCTRQSLSSACTRDRGRKRLLEESLGSERKKDERLFCRHDLSARARACCALASLCPSTRLKCRSLRGHHRACSKTSNHEPNVTKRKPKNICALAWFLQAQRCCTVHGAAAAGRNASDQKVGEAVGWRVKRRPARQANRPVKPHTSNARPGSCIIYCTN